MRNLNRWSTTRSMPLWAFVLLAVAASLLVPGALLSGNAPTSDDELHFCYVPGSGTVYRINAPGLRAECASPNHVPFTVSADLAEGAVTAEALAEGAVTAPALGPIVTRTEVGVVGAMATNRVLASCEEGERLISGGGAVTTIIAGSVPVDVSIIRMGRSTSLVAPPESWEVVATNRTDSDRQIRADAYCLAD
jgi:hypothetical protein